MKLSELTKNQKATISYISCDDELKQRFYSFGIIQGAQIIINEVSLAKNTIAIEVDNTEIAMRAEEANKVEVEVA